MLPPNGCLGAPHPPPGSPTHTQGPPEETRPAFFWATQQEEKASRKPLENSRSPWSFLLRGPLPPAPCPRRGSPHSAAPGGRGRGARGADTRFQGPFGEACLRGHVGGREWVGHKKGLSPSLAKAPRRPGCSFPQSGCPDARDGGGAGRGGASAGRWLFVHLAPARGAGPSPPLPSPPARGCHGPAPQGRRRECPRPLPWQFPPPLPVTLSSPPPNDFTFPKDPLRLSGPPRGPPPEIRSVCRGRGAPRGANPFSECHFEQQSAKLRKTSPPFFLLYAQNINGVLKVH